MRILAGDIGGTTTRLALYEGSPEAGFREERVERHASGESPGLDAILRRFLGDGPVPERAGLGVAGPVVGGVCQATNLPWVIDAAALERELGIAHVTLANDFHAVAVGVGELGAKDLHVLQDAKVDPNGPVAIVGAGTGLGEALVVPGPPSTPSRVLTTEGGHVDFAPRNETEVALLQFLWTRHRRVSVERVVSGRGLHAVYDFVVASGLAESGPELTRALTEEDPGKAIGEAALAGSDEAAAKAVSLFLSAYGAEAGNLALKSLPTGGLYVAGGIAPRLLPLVSDGTFMAAFKDKGRMAPLLDDVRVAVITHPHVGLLGARALALTS